MTTIIFETEQQALLAQLQQIGGIVEKRSTVPTLSNVLIKKEGTRSILTTTDLEIQMQNQGELGGDPSIDYQITIAIKKLIDILKTLPNEQKIKMEDKEGQITLKAGRSNFKIQSLPASDFPLLKSSNEFNKKVQIKQSVLKKLLQQTAFAMAVQDIRHYLNGVFLKIEGTAITAVATDGHRLAYNSVALDEAPSDEAAPAESNEVILPRKIINELLRLLSDNDEPIEIAFSSNQAHFKLGELEIVSKLIEGKFPDYNRVIPKNHEHQLLVSKTTLQAALQRASVMMSDKFKGVRLYLEPGLLRVSSNNNEQEEAIDEIDVSYNGPVIEIGFNLSYLQDVLGHVSQDMVKVELQDDNSSALLTVPELDGFKYVVMPMRI